MVPNNYVITLSHSPSNLKNKIGFALYSTLCISSGCTLSTMNFNGRKLRNAKLLCFIIIIRFLEDLEHSQSILRMTDWWAIDRNDYRSQKGNTICTASIIKLVHFSRGYSRVCQLIHSKLCETIQLTQSIIDYGDLISFWGFIEIEMLWYTKHKYASNLFCSTDNWAFSKISSPPANNFEINDIHYYQFGIPFGSGIDRVTPFGVHQIFTA